MKVSMENNNNLGYEKIVQIYFYASSPDAAASRICLPRKYGCFVLLIDNNLLLPGAKLHILNNIYRKIKIDLASLRSVHN
jgi:hypothetical protein